MEIGTPGRIRTCGLRIRSPLLYPAELQAHIEHFFLSYVCFHVHRNAGIDLFLFDLKHAPGGFPKFWTILMKKKPVKRKTSVKKKTTVKAKKTVKKGKTLKTTAGKKGPKPKVSRQKRSAGQDP